MTLQKTYSVCFIGHRKIKVDEGLKKKVYNLVEDFIINKKVSIFLFGSKSEFNSFCYDIVTGLKNRYPFIKRIYVRGEYQYIYDEFKAEYFLDGYEDTYLPNRCKVGSKASLIERNFEMIDKSDFCVFYYDKGYVEEKKRNNKRSGTLLSLQYAKRKGKLFFLIEHK